jgi:hypothetical protein
MLPNIFLLKIDEEEGIPCMADIAGILLDIL